ncbi:MAG: hypothetical protein JWO86_7619 [Myxococcaceae bacterium]|nr:hypothetical protein [Myxococcaceae bacterium]
MRSHSLHLVDRLCGSSGTGRVLRRHGRSMMLGGSILMVAGVVFAQGGTAKPPTVSGVPTNKFSPTAGPLLRSFSPLAFPNPGSNGDVGFSVSGHAQAVTVNGGCAGPGGAGQTAGGTLTINGMVITIPSDTIVQFPANSLTWADSVCPTNLLPAPSPLVPPSPSILSSLALDGSGGTFTPAGGGGVPGPILPAVEFAVDGNIIGGAGNAGVGSIHVAGLVSVSQQALNAGAGFISRIDYTDGSIYVSSPSPIGGAAAESRLVIADPIGRYGRAQLVPDLRFSVDTSNPTIKAGASGYPMCVPRFDPAIAPDPQCPQTNRPTGACRTFASPSAAGNAGLVGSIALAGGGLGAISGFRIAGADVSPTPPVPGGFCTAFVMPALQGYPGAAAAGPVGGGNVVALAAPGGALAAPGMDPREQAPFEVGDFIQWAGTLVRGGNTPPAAADVVNSGDVVWVHTIEANVAIYTQPRTLPAYIGVGELGIGVDPSSKAAGGTPGIESTARIFLEANTSDVGSIVDVYLDDKGFAITPATTRPIAAGGNFLAPVPGAEYFRWVTTEGMTGSLALQADTKNYFATTAQPFGGGIQTQYVGPQPGRARIRANAVPSINTARVCPAGGAPGTLTAGADQGCAVTNSPTRYIRATLRSLCAPAIIDDAGAAIPASNLDNGVVAGGTPWININAPLGTPPTLPGAGPGAAIPGDAPSTGLCLERAQFANGLFTGQYMAPMGEFIFPENTLGGFPVVPATTWQLGFLVHGEGSLGGSTGASTAPPVPSPW